MATTLHQRRGLVSIAGGRRFRIEAEVADAGDLPDRGLFVYNIRLAKNAALDSFVRIAEPADIDIFLTDRARALAAGQAYYRRADYVVDFVELEAADATAKVITSTVSRLYDRWMLYNDSFSTTAFTGSPSGTEITTFPLDDSAPLDVRIATYEAAVVASADADADVVAKEASIERLEFQITELESRHLLVSSVYDAVVDTQTYGDNLAITIGPGVGVVNTLLDGVSAASVAYEADIVSTYIHASALSRAWVRDPDPDESEETNEGILAVQLRSARVGVENIETGWARLRARLATLANRAATLLATLNSIESDLATRRSSLAVATAELIALETAQALASAEVTSALASVRELSPTYGL